MARAAPQTAETGRLTARPAVAGAFDRTTRSRGEVYFERGRVMEVTPIADHYVVGEVVGSMTYELWIRFEGESKTLFLFCDCPVGDHYGTPCKHLWALLCAVDAKQLLPAARRAPAFHVELAEDDELDAFGDDGGPTQPERAAETPTVETRAILADLIHRGAKEAQAQAAPITAAPGRKLVAALDRSGDPDEPLGLWILTDTGYDYVHVSSAQVLRAARPGSVDADIALLALRQSRYEAADFSPGLSYARPEGCRVTVPDGDAAVVLERLARAERLVVSDPTGAAIPVAWSDEPSPRLRLTVEANRSEAGYLLTGHLATGETSIALGSIDVAHGSGVLLIGNRLMALSTRAEGLWLSILSHHGQEALLLSPAELEEFLEGYFTEPLLPEIQLPAGLELPPTSFEPERFVDVGAPDGSNLGLPLSVGLRFGDKEVSLLSDRSWVVDLAENARYERDPEGEAEMLTELEGLGVRLVRPPDSSQSDSSPSPRDDWPPLRSFRIGAKRVPELAMTLIERGWSVSVERKAYRRMAGLHVRGSSGIDWLELGGTVDLGGEELPLGELLRALRRRQRSGRLVELGRTTVVASEELLDRLQKLLDLGTEGDDGAVRLPRSHAGAALALMDSADSRSEDADFKKLRRCLEEGLLPKTASAPRGFRGTLRDYQKQGLGWLKWLESAGFGGCLADDMGLGKTIQVLALLLARGRKHGPALVVAPRSVLHNWADEADRFAPALRPAIHWGPERATDAGPLRAARLVVTTYGTLTRDIELLSSVTWDYVVLDEAQAIKNRSTQTAQVVRQLESRHRLALSGTPIENHLDELWALLDFLNPGFGKRAPTKAGALSPSERALVSSLIRPFVLRRTKRQVASDLPERTEQTLTVELGRQERRRYNELHQHFRREYSEAVERLGIQRSTPILLTGLLRLRQAACHQGLIDDRQRARPSSKLALLLERLEELAQEGQKALVFSQFTDHLDLVEPHLRRAGIGFTRLDGKTRRRAERVKAFQEDPAITAFLISLKAGGTGLNLTAAEYVFLLDPWWNPATEAQAIDRCHRIGQTAHVVAYRLIAAGTVEEKVAALQQRKRELVDSVFGDDDAFLGKLSRDDLEALLG